MFLSEVEINAMLIVVGGIESVTIVLTGITNYLLRDTNKHDALAREIRSSFPREKDINVVDLSRLPYLTLYSTRVYAYTLLSRMV